MMCNPVRDDDISQNMGHPPHHKQQPREQEFEEVRSRMTNVGQAPFNLLLLWEREGTVES